MADDDVDHELLALLRQKFGLGGSNPNAPPETRVLENAQFIYDNSIDVALGMSHTKLAAIAVLEEMQKREYSTKTWAEHELHPKPKDEATVNFIFTMDLLNFSFWSEKSEEQRFAVNYKGKNWTGYWSLVASLQRALDEGIPITTPDFWINEGDAEDKSDAVAATSDDVPPPWADPEAPRLPDKDFDTGIYPDPAPEQQPKEGEPAVEESLDHQAPEKASDAGTNVTSNEPTTTTNVLMSENTQETKASDALPAEVSVPPKSDNNPKDGAPLNKQHCTEDLLRYVFRSTTSEEIPMFAERVQCLREAGRVLHEQFDGSVVTLIGDAKGSAAGLVNLLAERFSCFRDEGVYERKKVRFLKRAQIFVADLWAAFEGVGHGRFDDIDKITMFADYRVPQILNSLGLISYCPPLEACIRRGEMITPGHSWELQIRGCSIWAIELLRREILKLQPDAKVNAILLDFFLYDLAKEKEKAGEETLPHHRTRSIWY